MSKWPTHTLAEVAESTVDGPFGSALKGDHYVEDHGVRVVRLANLGDGRYVDSDEAFVSAEYADVLARHSVAPGDVLVASLGDDNHRPGRACLYPPEFTPGIVKADCFRVRPGELIDGRFLMETLNSERVIDQTRRLAQGVTRDRINLGQLRKVRVPVPPLEEQRRMAEILDTIDETIRATGRVIAKLEALHDGLRRELVPERLCEGVEEARLGDLIDPSRPIVYGILMPGDHVNGGVPVVKVKDIRGGAIADRRTLLHTSRQIDEQYARSRVREGDLLFTIRGTVGRIAVVPAALHGTNITQDTARLALDGVNRSFLLAAMSAGPFSRFVDVHTIGQAVKGINLRELRQALVLLLPRDQQEIVGSTLEDSLALIDAERRRLDKLRLLRSGLGADLLSGRVRTVTE